MDANETLINARQWDRSAWNLEWTKLELFRLNERRRCLDAFMTGNGAYGSLPEGERACLVREARALMDYTFALADRIALWERAAKESEEAE